MFNFFPYYRCWSLEIYRWYVVPPWLFFIFFYSSEVDAFLALGFRLWNGFFALLNAWYILSCMVILHSSLHHGSGLFLILCNLEFVCCWGYGLLEFVNCFVNLVWVKFRFCFFLGELKRLYFLDILASLFFLYSILVGGKFELWWYCLYRRFLWGSGRCRISLLEFLILSVELARKG